MSVPVAFTKVGSSGNVGGVTASTSPSAANIQGALHIGGYLSDAEERKRKKKKHRLVKSELDWQEQLMQKSMQDQFLNKAGARHNKKDQEMVQTMHDHAVSLGAHCLGNADDVASKRAPDDLFKVQVSDDLGCAFGWAIVCKVNGKPYWDLNIDPDGSKVPEHIPEDAMVKSALDFAMTARPGNIMHSGDEVGTYAFIFPWTTEIAKAMGVENPAITGLMVAYKGPPEVMAKFKDNTFRGFSIEGRRVAVEEMEDAS